MPRRLQLVLAAESYKSARLMSNRRITRGVRGLDMKQGQNLAMHDTWCVSCCRTSGQVAHLNTAQSSHI